MARNGKKKTTPSSSGGSSTSVAVGKSQGTNRVALEIKDLMFETTGTKNGTSSSASATQASCNEDNNLSTVESGFTIKVPSNSKLERILSELESGCLAEVGGEEPKNSLLADDAIGYLRKKMAALGFQAGIQLSNGGAFRDARRLLDGFPGDDEFELTFEEVESSEDLTEDEDEDEVEVEADGVGDEEDEKIRMAEIKKHLIESEINLDEEDEEGDDVDDLGLDLDFLSIGGRADDSILNGSGLEALDPLKVLSSKLAKKASESNGERVNNLSGLNYPLIDPLKLQVIQSAESELTTVHDLFETTNLSSSQKLPLLKRKYMELMQQDIRHRLEALRVRDYLDTLHLERQVVERELEKAVNLRSSMEQLCERLQAENAKIRAEKAGITNKIYGELELRALEEELAAEEGSGSGSSTNNNNNNNSNKGNKKTNGKKQNDKKTNNNGLNNGNTNNNSNTNNNNTNNNNNNNNNKTLNVKSLPTNLPDAIKSISFEVPDANRLLEGAQGDLRARFQLLIDLYNQREGHFVSVLRAKDAEIQLLQGHFFAHQSQIQKLNVSNRELNGKLADLSSSESDLRAQLSVYVDKFRQVEDTLSKSNDLFATFRHEMEQMTQKLSRLEKENQSLQSKCTTLSRNIIEMADERSKQAAAIDLLRNQKSKLESLCRTMQAERNAALQLQNQQQN